MDLEINCAACAVGDVCGVSRILLSAQGCSQVIAFIGCCKGPSVKMAEELESVSIADGDLDLRSPHKFRNTWRIHYIVKAYFLMG
jgi:hypothetical protein